MNAPDKIPPEECEYRYFVADLFKKDTKEFNSIFLSNIHHAYAQTDGSYRFPNSREGDMLKTAKREIETLCKMLNS